MGVVKEKGWSSIQQMHNLSISRQSDQPFLRYSQKFNQVISIVMRIKVLAKFMKFFLTNQLHIYMIN